MRCPTCGAWTNVLVTRDVRRRRECANGHRFYTQEIAIPDPPRGGVRKTVPVKAVDPSTGAVRVFPSAVHAEQEGYRRKAISMCLGGHQKLHMGLKWERV